MIKEFFLHPFILSLVIGLLVFIFCYIRYPSILIFIKKRTLSSQKEVLRITDMMMIKSSEEKIITWLWTLGLSFGFLIFLACWPHLHLGLILGIAGFLGSWMVVQNVMQTVWESRCSKVVNEMVEGLTIMTNGVKVGLSITQSMERVCNNMSDGPLAQEFKLILNKIRLGMSVEEAFNEMEMRIRRQDVTMMVIAINILKETGGNIAETLSVIADTIRDRQKVEGKISAMTAQGMTQAVIISLVPIVLLIVMSATNPRSVELLLTTPLGWFALLAIIGLVITGGILMKKIVTIKI